MSGLEPWLEQTEIELGVRFPKAYRDAQLARNGGDVEDPEWGHVWRLFPIADKTDRKSLTRTFEDVVRGTGEAREWENFPKGAVAIAENGSGDYLCFVEDNGQLGADVFLWEHEDGVMRSLGDFTVIERL